MSELAQALLAVLIICILSFWGEILRYLIHGKNPGSHLTEKNFEIKEPENE